MGDGYEARLSPRWRRGLLVLAAILVSPVVWQDVAGPAPGLGRVVAIGLAAGQVAALWWLGQAPRLVTGGILAAGAVLQLLVPGVGAGLAFVVLCTYAWAKPAAESLWALGGTIVAVCVPAAVRARWLWAGGGPATGQGRWLGAGAGPATEQGRWLLAGGWLAAALLAWSWGALGRARGARREAERRQAVLEERGRIARELHDVLSHTVTVMVVQAAAADDVFEFNPGQAREAIRRTEAAGREALAELRTFLRTVREGDGEPDGEQDSAGWHDMPPQPGLAEVDRLARIMAGAGLAVTVRREGEGEPPPGVQLGAYRIVQEALTNTLRHSGAEQAEVLIHVTGTEVEVEVRDDGNGGAGSTPGTGIRGMRERAALLNGTLTAGSDQGNGFRVRARLPWGEAAGRVNRAGKGDDGMGTGVDG
ncbi:sensor histidine kinase [Actinoplanes sp. NPDC020271]|uniref:sensor histidine kinase n=1 Tax=Actinoplanes sp. NPDC020271 TaxID=3363896 RepID=UPI0037B21621